MISSLFGTGITRSVARCDVILKQLVSDNYRAASANINLPAVLYTRVHEYANIQHYHGMISLSTPCDFINNFSQSSYMSALWCKSKNKDYSAEN